MLLRIYTKESMFLLLFWGNMGAVESIKNIMLPILGSTNVQCIFIFCDNLTSNEDSNIYVLWAVIYREIESTL